MNQLTRSLSCEWAKDNIRVNAVAPWYIGTPLAEEVLRNEEYKAQVISRTPMGRVGDTGGVDLRPWLGTSGGSTGGESALIAAFGLVASVSAVFGT